MLKSHQVLQNKYQLKKQLSHNPTRQTWLAEDIESQKNTIVKLLPFTPQTQWQDIKLFEREAQVLQHLDLLQVPHYLDYFPVEKEVDGELPWFALVHDYVPGSSLQDLLKMGKTFAEAEVRDIAKQLLKIIIGLHELSPPVLHRDIKPSNIIRGKNNQIHLIDFGAVQEKARAEGVTFTVVGTGGYAPPEQLWGRAVAASDLYALGATLVHLLTGIAPGKLPQHRMRLRFRDKVKVTSEFASWLDKLLDPAVEKRFTSARQALGALEAAERQETAPKVRYGRLGGLALLQYGVVGLCAMVLHWVMVSRYVHEGKKNVKEMNRAQQAHFINEGEFSNSIYELNLNIQKPTESYKYSVRAAPFAAFNYANSRKIEIRTYMGIVALSGTKIPGETVTKMAICEAEEIGIGYLQREKPFIMNGTVYCPTGTKTLTGSDRAIEIEGKDWQLAYKALDSARAGRGNLAVGHINQIDDPATQKRALDAIAPYLMTSQLTGNLWEMLEHLQDEGNTTELIETLLGLLQDSQSIEEAGEIVNLLQNETDFEGIIERLEQAERDR
ncbi:MAG: type IV pilin-like G/H family protein [Cyanobacteriota bacterium]|nr:type IV pilin-like G/H family protein [Cyanobacteriota bacterium]